VRPPLKRCPPGLTDDERSDFLERQAEYDDILRAEGFRDVENGADMSELEASTFPGGADEDPAFDRPENAPGPVRVLVRDGKPCNDVVEVKTPRKGRRRRPHRSLEALGSKIYEQQTELYHADAGEGQQLGLTASADYTFWRLVGLGVHALPPNWKHRAFLLDLAESGDLLGSARQHGLTHAQGRHVFKKLLDRIGLGKSPAARAIRGK
jgi:hypothetical protein